jgi:ABC-type transport system substrate-binding protein
MKDEKSSTALAFALIMLIPLFAVAPAKAFIYPDTTYDTKYESYGPHADQIINQMYLGTDPEFTALALGQIDLTDEPLDMPWLVTFSNEPYFSNVSVVSAGGEAGYYTLDFNYNPNPKMGQIFPFVQPYGQPDPAGRPNPVYIKGSSYSPTYPYDFPPISNDVNFRLGVCSLFDRATYTGIIGSAGVQMLTPVPAYMGGPGGYVWEACPGYQYNTTLADQYFNASRIFKDAATGKRFWDKNGDGVAQQAEFDACKLIFTYRSTPEIRRQAGIMLTTEMQNMGFEFKAPSGQVTAGTNYQIVMLDKNYHMTTLGWIFIGPDPDFLYDLYHISSYWDDPESSCSNTAALNDTVLDDLAVQIKLNMDPAAAKAACITFQQRFWVIAAQLPLACNNAFKAMSKYYTGGTQSQLVTPDDGENQYRQYPNGTKRAWTGAANQAGFGSNSWFSKLDMYSAGNMYGASPMTIRYGWSETGYPQHINPFYSEWYWDSEVLGPIYDSLGYRNPYNLAQWKGDIAQSWSVGVWDDSGVNNSKVTVTIRPDCRFQDGTPITIGDVIFSIVDAGKELVSKGYAPPWWWPTGALVRSVCQLDAYTVEILYGVSSYLVEGWTLGGFYIVPKHIWKPIIDSSNPNPPNTAVPDPNIIGSGPYRFKSWTLGVALVMVANKPGSTVNTGRPGSSPITSPGYHAWLPVEELIYTNDGKHRYDPGTVVTFNVETDNLWWGGSLDVEDTVTITWPNATVTTIIYTMTLPAHTSDVHTFTYTWPYCRTAIEAASKITSAGPWQNQAFTTKKFIWGTIIQDIAGSNLYKDMGWLLYPYSSSVPTPDCKVDATDLAIVQNAWGSKPGDARWNPVADVVHDYRINTKDVATVGDKVGWPGGTPYDRDVAVTAVTVPKKVVFQGSCVDIKVTVENQGGQSETFNLLLKANDSIVQTEPVSISVGSSMIVAFTWNTSGWAKGNYTISAEASIAIDIDPADNNLTGGWIVVSMVGDIRDRYGGPPDGKCTAPDVSYISSLYGAKYPDPKYDPDCDQTSRNYGVPDWQITAPDVSLVSSHYGAVDP